MSWMWWLAAPVLSTLLGAGVLGWRDRRANTRSHRDPAVAHRALLEALEQVRIPDRRGA